MGTLRSTRPIRIRSTIQKEPLVSMSLLITGIHHYDLQMAMCRRMVTAHTRATLDMAITTMDMWLMKEDTQHPEVTCRKVLKRREIETINPLGISTQIVSGHRRKNVTIVKEREVTMNEVIQRKRVGLVA